MIYVKNDAIVLLFFAFFFFLNCTLSRLRFSVVRIGPRCTNERIIGFDMLAAC